MKRNDWMLITLVLAGIYNLLWGAWVVLFPTHLFDLLGMPAPGYIEIWQCVGMIVGVYGVGYLISATKPLVHWPIVLVGLLGKIFGPIGFAQSLYLEKLPLKFGLTLITNDFIWWIPFFLILKAARDNYLLQFESKNLIFDDVFPSELLELSHSKKLVLVFLRHCGCTFTRETLKEIEDQKQNLSTDSQLVLIHMGSSELSKQWSDFYQLSGVTWLEDPDRKLYQAAGLKRGRFSELFNFNLVLKGIKAFSKGHGVGPQDNDGFQMPGIFLLQDGKLTTLHHYKDVADTPDFRAIFQSV